MMGYYQYISLWTSCQYFVSKKSYSILQLIVYQPEKQWTARKNKSPDLRRDLNLSHINLSKILVGRCHFFDHNSVCRHAQRGIAL
jgi:hypothetical protein